MRKGRPQLPFWFTQLLMQCSTDDPARLKKACDILRIFGEWKDGIRRVLIG